MSNITISNKAQLGQEPSLFKSRWDTTQVGPFGKRDLGGSGSPNDTVILPLTSDGSYNFDVDWGDGNRDNITGYNQSEVTHQYSNTGIYEIRIKGDITGWQFNDTVDDDKILDISEWGPLRFTTGNINIFRGCRSLDVTATDTLVLPANASTMFYNAYSINYLYASNWDTSACTNMASISFPQNFNEDVGNWDVSNVTDLGSTFSFCTGFNNAGSSSITGWDVSNVTSMNYLFSKTLFNHPIGVWNVSNVTSMASMFYGFTSDPSPFNQDLSSWDVSNVTNMNNMFAYGSFNNSSITGWNTSSVTSMDNMFDSNTGFNQPIGSWDVSNATSFNSVFRGTVFIPMSFNQDVSSWNVSGATYFLSTFRCCTGFNQPIGNWTTTSIFNASSMLEGCSGFDQDLSNWNVSSLRYATDFMKNCTLSTTNYDRILSGWSPQSVQNGVSISFGNSQYSTATGASYRSTLVSKGWTITDGGAV